MAKQENKFALQTDPTERIKFSSPELGPKPVTVTMKLKNTASERLAYKVKCTSNGLFRIRPPVGTVDAGATAEVQLTFATTEKDPNVPESGRHYFAVYHIKAPKADEKPRDVWSNHKGNADGEKRLHADFSKEAAPAAAAAPPAKPAAEEKKPTEEKKEAKEEAKKPDPPKKEASAAKPVEKPAETKDDDKKEKEAGGKEEKKETKEDEGDDDSGKDKKDDEKKSDEKEKDGDGDGEDSE